MKFVDSRHVTGSPRCLYFKVPAENARRLRAELSTRFPAASIKISSIGSVSILATSEISSERIPQAEQIIGSESLHTDVSVAVTLEAGENAFLVSKKLFYALHRLFDGISDYRGSLSVDDSRQRNLAVKALLVLCTNALFGFYSPASFSRKNTLRMVPFTFPEHEFDVFDNIINASEDLGRNGTSQFINFATMALLHRFAGMGSNQYEVWALALAEVLTDVQHGSQYTEFLALLNCNGILSARLMAAMNHVDHSFLHELITSYERSLDPKESHLSLTIVFDIFSDARVHVRCTLPLAVYFGRRAFTLKLVDGVDVPLHFSFDYFADLQPQLAVMEGAITNFRTKFED